MNKIYKNINQIISLKTALEKDGRFLKPEDIDLIEDGAIVFNDKQILWTGKTEHIPDEYSNDKAYDLKGYVVTPEIVDSHTHLVFGGNRAFEYSMRLNGANYQDIANAGGGILATMEKTITTSEEELFKLGIKRIESIKSYGVGTIEIKSGYGLTYESELRLSRVIHRLKEHFKDEVQIINTFLAAHAVPGSFKNSRSYLEKIVLPLFEELIEEKIIDFVDIFHEQGYFDLKDSELLFEAAQKHGIKIKIHADEFADNEGALLATKFNATSADHLLSTSDSGILALANSNTVATLLPGTAFFLGKPLARARKFLDAGCKVALASDYNPGSCHCDNLLLIAAISAKSLQLNIAELWSAITLNASHALNLKNQGAIVKGLAPRFSIFKCESVDEITYNWGKNLFVSKI